MKSSAITLLLLFACSLLLAQTKKVSKTFSDIRTIQVRTSSGDVILKPGTAKDVKVDLSYTYSDDEFKPQMDNNGGKLVLEEDFSRGSHSGSSTWTIEVPAGLAININTGSGGVEANGISGELKVNLGSGNVTLEKWSGSVDVNTGSGNIEISGGEAEVSLNTGSGDIQLSDASGKLSANAGSGSIILTRVSGSISANTGSGDVKAGSVVVKGKSKFNTGSGDAEVTLAGPLEHNISVNSGSGDATLNFSGNEISGEVVMMANKKGGRIVAPFEFQKEETVENDGNQVRIYKTAVIGNKGISIKVGTGSGTAQITR